MQVVARSGEALLIADDLAAAILQPSGGVHIAPLAVIVAHGQWAESDEPIPDYAPPDLAERLAVQNRLLRS